MMADISVESHHKQVLNKLKDLWKDDLFCDVTLLADGGETRIPAHRNVLAASSGYFHDKFTESMPEDNEVVLEHIDGATLKQMVTYYYSGAFDILEALVLDPCLAANELQTEALEALHNTLSPQIDGSMPADLYHEKVVIKLKDLWENNMFCDVTLIAGDDEHTRIPAHRNVLVANSNYFKNTFTGSWKEATAQEVVLGLIDGATLGEIVSYCYSGAIKVEDSAHSIAVCQAAEYLQMDTLLHKLSTA